MSFSHTLKRLSAAAFERQRGISETHRLIRADDLLALLDQFNSIDSQYRASLTGVFSDPKALSMTVSALSESHPEDESGFYSLARAMNDYLYDDKLSAYEHLETAINEHSAFRKAYSSKAIANPEGLGVDYVGYRSGGLVPKPPVHPGPRNFTCCPHCQKPMQKRFWLFGEHCCGNSFCASKHGYIPVRHKAPADKITSIMNPINPPGDD